MAEDYTKIFEVDSKHHVIKYPSIEKNRHNYFKEFAPYVDRKYFDGTSDIISNGDAYYSAKDFKEYRIWRSVLSHYKYQLSALNVKFFERGIDIAFPDVYYFNTQMKNIKTLDDKIRISEEVKTSVLECYYQNTISAIDNGIEFKHLIHEKLRPILDEMEKYDSKKYDYMKKKSGGSFSYMDSKTAYGKGIIHD